MADLGYYPWWKVGLEAHISKAVIVEGGLTPPPSKIYPGTKCYMVTVTVDGSYHHGFGPTPIIAKNAALQFACEGLHLARNLAQLELQEDLGSQDVTAPELNGTGHELDNTAPELDNTAPEVDITASDTGGIAPVMNNAAQQEVNEEQGNVRNPYPSPTSSSPVSYPQFYQVPLSPLPCSLYQSPQVPQPPSVLPEPSFCTLDSLPLPPQWSFSSPCPTSDVAYTPMPLVLPSSVPHFPLPHGIALQPALSLLASDPPQRVAPLFSHGAPLCPPPMFDEVPPSPAPSRLCSPVSQSKDLLQNTNDQNHGASSEINLCSISPFDYSAVPDPLQFTVRLPKTVQLKTSSKPQWKDYGNKQQTRQTRGRVWNGVNELGEILGGGDNSRDPWSGSLQTCAMVELEKFDLGISYEEEGVIPVPLHSNNDQVNLDMLACSFADFNRKKVKLDTLNHSTDPIALPTHFILQHLDMSDQHYPNAKADGLAKDHDSVPTSVFDGGGKKSTLNSVPTNSLEGRKTCSTEVITPKKSQLNHIFWADVRPNVCVCLPSEGLIPK